MKQKQGEEGGDAILRRSSFRIETQLDDTAVNNTTLLHISFAKSAHLAEFTPHMNYSKLLSKTATSSALLFALFIFSDGNPWHHEIIKTYDTH